MYVTDIKVNDDHKLAIFSLDQFGHFPGNIPDILFYNNGLGGWHSLPDISHSDVNNGNKSAILNLIELSHEGMICTFIVMV